MQNMKKSEQTKQRKQIRKQERIKLKIRKIYFKKVKKIENRNVENEQIRKMKKNKKQENRNVENEKQTEKSRKTDKNRILNWIYLRLVFQLAFQKLLLRNMCFKKNSENSYYIAIIPREDQVPIF